VTWHRGFAWTAAGITGVVLCTAVWLTAQDPSPAHQLILAAAVILGVVPAAAGVFVAQDRGTGVLGVLLVLPGLNAALLFTEVLAQDVAALLEAQKNYRALISEFQQTKQTELAAAETKAASLIQEVVKAGQRTDLQTLSSPIDGVVQQLAVHTVGGVVTPAQQLLIVVPQEHPIEVLAEIENKDIGFVKEEQPDANTQQQNKTKRRFFG